MNPPPRPRAMQWWMCIWEGAAALFQSMYLNDYHNNPNYYKNSQTPNITGVFNNKVNHERGTSSLSTECLDSCMLRHNLKEKWRGQGNLGVEAQNNIPKILDKKMLMEVL